MNSGQKAVKYIGIFIGLLLAICIIGSIARLAMGFIRWASDSVDVETTDFAQSYSQPITGLRVQNSVGEVRLVAGDEWRVEAANVTSSFKSEVQDGRLSIREDGRSFFFHLGGGRTSVITVYVPAGRLDSVFLDTGAGKVSVDAALEADTVRVDGGAGECRLTKVTAGSLKVDQGAGRADVLEGDVGRLELDGGVGSFRYTGRLAGDADIDGGVGEVRLELTGSASDFNYDVDNGVGDVRVDGDKLSDGKVQNPGASHTMKVDNGVGAVIINFTAE